MAVVELAFIFGDALKLHSSNSSSSSFDDSCIKLLRLADTYYGDDLSRSLSISSSISSLEEESLLELALSSICSRWKYLESGSSPVMDYLAGGAGLI